MSLAVSFLTAWHGRIPVCRDIAFEAQRGEFLVVLGANGAGKSSLLGALAGAVAARGTVRLDDRDLSGLSARARARRGLSFVPEGRRNLFPDLTVDENLRLGLRLLPPGERPAMRARLLALFPILAARGTQASGLLSGGEQQMLALAAALARNPSCLMLDEPTQGLAPIVLDEIAAAIGKLRGLGLTLILAEQNYRFAASLADRYIVLRGGETAGGGAGSELADRERAARMVMGH